MIPIIYADIIDDPVHLARFEEIYVTYYKQMHYTANKILNDPYEAEDALQDAFIGIARNMKTVSRIKSERDLYAYLQTAARHAALNRLPKEKIYKDAIPLDKLPNISDNSFWTVLCERLDYTALAEIFTTIPLTYREALYYHFVLEFTIKETAAALNIGVPAAKQRLVRGKRQLIKAIHEKGCFEHGAN